jgi:hypothetical protein
MAIVNTGATVPPSLVDVLNRKWRGGKICPVCGTNGWNVEPQLAELRFLSVEAFVVGGPVIPLVVITCNNCGNTVLINAIKAGWQPAVPPQAGPAQGGGL